MENRVDFKEKTNSFRQRKGARKFSKLLKEEFIKVWIYWFLLLWEEEHGTDDKKE